jgi:hypothetical protein
MRHTAKTWTHLLNRLNRHLIKQVLHAAVTTAIAIVLNVGSDRKMESECIQDYKAMVNVHSFLEKGTRCVLCIYHWLYTPIAPADNIVTLLRNLLYLKPVPSLLLDKQRDCHYIFNRIHLPMIPFDMIKYNETNITKPTNSWPWKVSIYLIQHVQNSPF